MQACERLYRFIEGDIEMAGSFLEDAEYELDYKASRTYDREKHAIDPSPLESYFEQRFADAYGEEAYKLRKLNL